MIIGNGYLILGNDEFSSLGEKEVLKVNKSVYVT